MTVATTTTSGLLLLMVLSITGTGCSGTTEPRPRGEPEITILAATGGSTTGTVRGTTTHADPHRMLVVLWARTDRWYVQPLIARPFTQIDADGSWQNWTHPWDRIVALLVDSSYVPGATRDHHPSSDSGVLAWDERPARSPDRLLSFSGYEWRVKASGERRVDPGPNRFSDLANDVWVDAAGLHLRTGSRGGHGYATEVVLTRSLGYGEYTFQLASRVDALDPQAVFAGFVYESATREIDIEFSHALAHPHNAQYVVQPYTRPGNLHRFTIGPEASSTHRFVWTPDSIRFESWRGHEPAPTSGTRLQSWTYRGLDVPPPGALMRFILWLFDGRAPQRADEVVIRSFRHRAPGE